MSTECFTKEPVYSKWVACWGNATSISDRKEAVFAKNLTLRYPIRMCFSGNALRFHFSNLTGDEAVTISAATAARCKNAREIKEETAVSILFQGQESVVIEPGEEIVSDELEFSVLAGEMLAISMYFAGYTQLNAGVLITGPLSKGFYSYGDYSTSSELPLDVTRNTNWFYFLNTIDVRTEEKNRALICYGDSITAQSWPDYLALRAASDKETAHTAIIRRAVSGTRILRQYDCITYAAYGIKGETRFPIEVKAAGADAVLIQHGINDIIHPVGEENPFRPWSDLPSVEQLIDGMRMYIRMAREQGLKVYAGTLLPIYGWRTYAPFREGMRNAFNEWIRTTDELDGYIDFDLAVCNPDMPEAFGPGCDSGDHLHPSELAYQKMAEAIPKKMLADK